MHKSQGLRVGICLAVGLLIVFVLLFFVPKHPYLPRGIILPGKKTFASTQAADIKMLSAAPFGAIQVGYIAIEQHYQPSKIRWAINAMSETAKQLAAHVGATAVVVTNPPSQPNPAIPRALQNFYLLGIAIRVPKGQVGTTPTWIGHFSS